MSSGLINFIQRQAILFISGHAHEDVFMKEKKMPQKEFMIKIPGKRIWVVIFALFSIAFLVIGYLYLGMETRNIRQEKSDDLASIAELKAAGIIEWRKERLNDATNLSKSPLFSTAIEEWLTHSADQNLRKAIMDRLSLTSQSYGYDNVLLVDKDGQTLISIKEEPESLNIETKLALEKAIVHRKAVLSELYRTESGKTFLDSIAPVIYKNESILGILILRSDAEAFLYPFIQSWPTPSQIAETLLIKQEDDEVIFLNELRHRKDLPLSLRFPMSQTSLLAVQAVRGTKGIIEGKDYRSQQVLADLHPVPDSSWFLITKVDTTEILAEARNRGAKTMVIVGLLVLIGAGLAFLGYRQQKTAYFRSLYQAEKKKREIEEELRTTLYSIGDAVITTDTDGVIKLMNPVAERLTGWSEDEALGKPLIEVFHIINEETRAEVDNPVKRVLDEGVIVGLANHTILVARNGQEIPIADAGAPIRDDKGTVLGVVLVFRDQTKERATQRALEENEEKYRSVVENSHAGILIVGEDYRFIFVNQKLCEMLGRQQEEIIGHDFREFLDEESKLLVAERYIRRQRGEEVPSRYEFNIIRKDGEKRRVEISSAIVKDSRGKVMTVAQILDITEKKQAEEALRASEEKYRILHEFAGEAIFTFTLDLKLMEINRAACDYIGHSREELLGKNIFELGILHPEDTERAKASVGKVLRGEKSISMDKFLFKGKHGLYSTFQVTSTPLIRNGEIVAITNVCRDVTLEERLYAELEASERKYRFLFNAGNDAIFVYGLTSDSRPEKFIEANELASALTGYSKEELMELTPVDLVVPEEKEQVYESNREISEKKHRIFERTLLSKGGKRIPCEISSHFFKLNGVPTILAIARDITERKTTEATLKTALKEKELMLREINHRVKNNMQIMSSLLRLQASQIAEKKAREALRKSQTRIHSMAMIHEKLYQSRNFVCIDFADYVQKLVTHLYVVYEVDQKRVHFNNEVGKVGLDINQAIPCGLIVNELVSNALKYAFAGRKKGRLSVRMLKDRSGKLHLLVKDTGKGLPKSIDVHKASTLGFQIVNDLTNQLSGTLEYRRGHGNEFEITF